MGSIRASVVIPAFNASTVIGEQLDALAWQVGAPSFEVVVADNGSTDDLGAVCAHFAETLNIRVVAAAERQGVSHARNRGVNEARGAVVLICDADDRVHPTWVSELVAAVGDGGRLAAGALDYEHFNDEQVCEVLGCSSRWAPGPYMDYRPFAFGCNFAISRADYLRIGGMDESIKGGSDDVEFSWRAQEAGMEFVFAPGAVVDYRLRSTPRTIFKQRRGYQRGDVLVWVRSRSLGRPVGGKSFKWSVGDVVQAFLRGARWPAMTPKERLAWARHAGGALGALEGHLRYRVMGRPSAPHLLAPDRG